MFGSDDRENQNQGELGVGNDFSIYIKRNEEYRRLQSCLNLEVTVSVSTSSSSNNTISKS